MKNGVKWIVALSVSIVIGVSFSAHADSNVVVLEAVNVVIGCVLHSLVGVMDQVEFIAPSLP